jgi:hypothetical protein
MAKLNEKLNELTKKIEAKNKQNKDKTKANIEFFKKNKDKFRWIFAVIFILIGISSFGDSIIGGLFYILLGLFLLPPTSSILNKNEKLKISQNNIAWYSIVLILFISSLNFVSSDKTEKIKSEFSGNSAAIINDIQKNIDSNNLADATLKISKYISALPANEDLKKLKIALDQKKTTSKETVAKETVTKETVAEDDSNDGEVGKNTFVDNPIAPPVSVSKSGKTKRWHCPGFVNKKLINIVYDELVQLSDSSGIIHPIKELCSFQISELDIGFGPVTMYSVDMYTSQNSKDRCQNDDYCDSFRSMHFKMKDGKLVREYFLTDVNKKINRFACIAFNGSVIDPTKGC